jgi:glycosyltransferase involved in cell wall biosynthesis
MASETPKPAAKHHCMVVHAFYPLGETRVQREALALLKQGYEVDVICLKLDGEPAVGEQYGVNIYRVPMKRHRGHGLVFQLLEYLTFFLLALFKLLTLHARRQYGTIQIHNPPDFLIFVALIPKLFGARLIIDLHDLMPEFYADKVGAGMNSWPVRLVRWQERASCRIADQVITVTDIWKQTLIQRGVPAGKVNVVMNVADPRVFVREAPPVEPMPEKNGFRLIYHGTFTYRYGLDLMIRALAEVRSQIPGVHLTLLGMGDAREQLIRLAKELKLEECVHFSPRTFKIEQLPPMIRQADAGIVANRNDVFTDGLLPTKMMEYVALGIPVIAARTSTISAYFDDEMVQFFEPGDVSSLAQSIIALSNDPQRLADLTLNSDKFNQSYRWDDIAASYVSIVGALY